MAKRFGETVRELREAQGLGLRVAAEHLGISPTYLSRIERGKERPPRPEVISRIAALLGSDRDILFRLSESTDPSLAEFIHAVPNVPEFLRTAIEVGLTSDDFAALIEEIKSRGSSRNVGSPER